MSNYATQPTRQTTANGVAHHLGRDDGAHGVKPVSEPASMDVSEDSDDSILDAETPTRFKRQRIDSQSGRGIIEYD